MRWLICARTRTISPFFGVSVLVQIRGGVDVLIVCPPYMPQPLAATVTSLRASRICPSIIRASAWMA